MQSRPRRGARYASKRSIHAISLSNLTVLPGKEAVRSISCPGIGPMRRYCIRQRRKGARPHQRSKTKTFKRNRKRGYTPCLRSCFNRSPLHPFTFSAIDKDADSHRLCAAAETSGPHPGRSSPGAARASRAARARVHPLGAAIGARTSMSRGRTILKALDEPCLSSPIIRAIWIPGGPRGAARIGETSALFRRRNSGSLASHRSAESCKLKPWYQSLRWEFPYRTRRWLEDAGPCQSGPLRHGQARVQSSRKVTGPRRTRVEFRPGAALIGGGTGCPLVPVDLRV